MKITRIETIVLNLPMQIDRATPMLGGKARTSIDMLLVRVDTDAGITGWGEAFGHRIFHATRAAIDTLVGPMFIGRDPSQILASHDEAQRVLHGVGRHGAHPRPHGWGPGGCCRVGAGGAPRCRRCGGPTSRSGPPGEGPRGSRSTPCSAAPRPPTCPPTRVPCATPPPMPWLTTPGRR